MPALMPGQQPVNYLDGIAFPTLRAKLKNLQAHPPANTVTAFQTLIEILLTDLDPGLLNSGAADFE